jgi:hypothetical protein
MFNFDSIMQQFYSWSPAADDAAGQALKNTFQGDFIQTVLNNQMSKDLAYANAEIATGQMTSAAALELANQTAVMKDEHAYGQIKMGAEYDYQSKFAVDSDNRKLNELAHTADLQQNQTKLEGDQNRLNIEAQGRNDIVLQDQKNKGAVDQINSQGNVDQQLTHMKGVQAIDQLKESGANDQALQGLKNSGAIDQINSQGFLDNEMQKLKGKQATDQIGAQGSVDLSKIKETGNQERQGMMQATKEDTKKQTRDSGMARSLAGMF